MSNNAAEFQYDCITQSAAKFQYGKCDLPPIGTPTIGPTTTPHAASTLPYTGWVLPVVVLAAIALLTVGYILRRWSKRA